MEMKCMNLMCRCTETYRWMTGWALKTGAFARLCFICGSAYERSNFCETFHREELGWRDCVVCKKPIHCGCIASKYTYEYLDLGGVLCKSCKNKECNFEQRAPISGDGAGLNLGTIASSSNGPQPSEIAINSGNSAIDKGKIVNTEDPDHNCPQIKRITSSSPIRQTSVISNEGADPRFGASSSRSNAPQSTQNENAGIVRSTIAQKTYFQNMTSLPICPQSLAKHLPKVSDEELQQIFGALNSNVTPLFEKVLTTTDVSRIGRLIIPKVCAVAYFPYIKDSAGIPITVIDTNGKLWLFQLRFWSNNNSRMYVFEGIQSYISQMGLQARDTVIFGLMSPGQLVMGFKKTPEDVPTENSQSYEHLNNFTWGQAQDLLQPNPKSKRNIVMIESCEFEEFDKPPVFGNEAEDATEIPGSSSIAPMNNFLNEHESPRSPDRKKPKVTDDGTGKFDDAKNTVAIKDQNSMT